MKTKLDKLIELIDFHKQRTFKFSQGNTYMAKQFFEAVDECGTMQIRDDFHKKWEKLRRMLR